MFVCVFPFLLFFNQSVLDILAERDANLLHHILVKITCNICEISTIHFLFSGCDLLHIRAINLLLFMAFMRRIPDCTL